MGAAVTVIANPAAHHGRLRRRIDRLHRQIETMFPGCVLKVTAERGEARALALEAAADGAQMIIVAGGNGTANEVADGLLSTGGGAEDLPVLGLAPVGVGIDLARSIELPKSLDAALRRLGEGGRTRTIDAARVEYRDDAGARQTRHFLNIASAGISAAIAGAVNGVRVGGLLPGPAMFFAKTLQTLMRHEFGTFSLSVDGAVVADGRMALIAVANGRFFGGGMAIAPEAVMDDGLLDVVAIEGASKMYLIDNLNRIYSGAHRNLPVVKIVRGRTVDISSPEGAQPLPIELDGETPGHGPVRIDVLPKALRIRG